VGVDRKASPKEESAQSYPTEHMNGRLHRGKSIAVLVCRASAHIRTRAAAPSRG